MAHTSFAVTLFWAYPAAICLVFLGSRLCTALLRKDIKSEIALWNEKNQRKHFAAIFWLQLFQCFDLMVTIAATGYVMLNDSHFPQTASWVNREFMASNIAVLMFFLAGLLPDPDLPFSPSISHCHGWIAGIVVETLQLAFFGYELRRAVALHNVVCILITCIALRLVGFLVMTALYLQPLHAWVNDFVVDAERLLNTDVPHYGISTGGKKRMRDAQHGVWTDYVVGFSVLFPFLWPSDSTMHQLRACFCFVLLILQRIVNILVPHYLGVVVCQLGSGVIPYSSIVKYLLLRGLQGQQGVIGSLRALLWIPISQSTYQRLTSSVFEHVLGLSLEFHLDKRIGEVMSALSKGSALNTFLDGFVFQLFPMVADLWIAAIYFLIEFDSFYSLLVIAITWLYLFVTIYMAKYRGRSRRKMVNCEREMEAAKTDALLSYETVHHNSAVPLERRRLNKHIYSFQEAEYSVFFSLNLLNTTQNLIFTAGVSLFCFLSAYQISVGSQEVAMFVTLITYLAQLQAPLNFFGSFYTQVQNNLVDAERMLSLFKEMPLVKDKNDAISLDSCKGRVVFSNVSFSYDERKPALHNVSFTVEPGTSTAIVGTSGSGKSTILKLLFRFYDISSGSILLDGIDIRDITLASMRSRLGVVPQDTILFNNTLMYNLLYARPDATEEEVYAACRAASIHDRIQTFPDGYDTNVGERGLRLSGGEKQRIAIARTFLRSPQILLLDEATSSLDSETEQEIQGALEYIARGRTTISIAHRLSTVTKADQIIVLGQGSIMERGTHTELLAARGAYSRMWEKQTEDDQKTPSKE